MARTVLASQARASFNVTRIGLVPEAKVRMRDDECAKHEPCPRHWNPHPPRDLNYPVVQLLKV